jgi:dolichol-phosphate mannosyltransferase
MTIPPAGAPTVVSIVIPTYNERESLEGVVNAVFAVFARANLDGELIIVDDGSPDGTGALALELARSRPIIVIQRPGKLGLGSAIIDGFAAAHSDIVGVMDGDLSHPPNLLPEMVAAFSDPETDFVIGSRYIPGGGTANWSLGRLFMSRLACWLARPLTPVRDATSGFFLLRRHVAEGVRIEAGGFKICLELFVRGHPKQVLEVPYVFRGRSAGQSKMNLREATGYLAQLALLLRYRYSAEGRGIARTRHRIGKRSGAVAASRLTDGTSR